MTIKAQISAAGRVRERPLSAPQAPVDELPMLAELAMGLLLLDDARLYGFIKGGPEIHRAECQAIVDRAKALGLTIDPDRTCATALELMAEMGAIRR